MGIITRIKANLSSTELGLTSQLELSLAKYKAPKTKKNKDGFLAQEGTNMEMNEFEQKRIFIFFVTPTRWSKND